VRCLRCAAMVCCSRWLMTSRGLVGELSTASFTLHATAAAAHKPKRGLALITLLCVGGGGTQVVK